MSTSPVVTGTAAPARDPHRKAALACGSLIAIAITLVAFGRHAPPVRTIDATTIASAVELKFDDLPDGTVVALDARTGTELDRVAPGTGGFIRVTMRSFAAERLARGLGADEPFTLARLNDGSLVLKDPVTGRTMLLNAFGPSNEGVFAHLLEVSAGLQTADNSTPERTAR